MPYSVKQEPFKLLEIFLLLAGYCNIILKACQRQISFIPSVIKANNEIPRVIVNASFGEKEMLIFLKGH